MAKVRANGSPAQEVQRLEALFQDLNVPTRLSQIDMDYDDAHLKRFTDELLVHSKVESVYHQRVIQAVRAIR